MTPDQRCNALMDKATDENLSTKQRSAAEWQLLNFNQLEFVTDATLARFTSWCETPLLAMENQKCAA